MPSHALARDSRFFLPHLKTHFGPTSSDTVKLVSCNQTSSVHRCQIKPAPLPLCPQSSSKCQVSSSDSPLPQTVHSGPSSSQFGGVNKWNTLQGTFKLTVLTSLTVYEVNLQKLLYSSFCVFVTVEMNLFINFCFCKKNNLVFTFSSTSPPPSKSLRFGCICKDKAVS